jgi:hypothetical protein
MIAKTKRDKMQEKRSSRQKEPVDVNLTVKFNFGDEADDAITILNDVRVPMVDSVFNNRDRIVKGFVSLLLKSGLKSPAVTREIFPIVKLLKRKK